MPRSLMIAAAAAAIVIAGALPAAAQRRAPPSDEILARIAPNQMAAVLRMRGNPVEVVTDGSRTRLRTEIGGRRVSVYFYACNDNGCQSIQYRAVFERHERFTLAFVNAWNYEKRFAKTYLTPEGNLVLEWDVDFDGGVSVGFVSETAATFQAMLSAFDRFTPRSQAVPDSAGTRATDGGGSAGRATAPDLPREGGRSLMPGTPPAERSPAPADPPGTDGKSTGEDRPGERRT